jgi:hypothetical protein
MFSSTCYLIVCNLGKSQPKKKVCDTTRGTYDYNLNRYPPHFSNEHVQHNGGFPSDPRGIARGEARR